MIVAYGGGGLGLAHESLAGRRIGGQFRCKDLDRHHAAELCVMGLEDDSHPAVADDIQYTIGTEFAKVLGIVRCFEEVKR